LQVDTGKTDLDQNRLELWYL